MQKPSSLKILVVEDEAMVNQLVQSQIKRLGYSVAGSAYNAESAVKMAADLKPGLILMDLHMMDPSTGKEDPEAGIKATREIQKNSPTPVIMLTAYENTKLVKRSVETGVGAYLLKPVQDNDLERAIITSMARFEDMLALRRMNAELSRANINLISEVTARKKAEEAAESRARQMTALYETSLSITSQMDLGDLLSTIVQKAADLIGLKYASLYLVSENQEDLNQVVTYNLPNILKGKKQRLNEGIAGKVLQTREPYFVEDYSTWEQKVAVYDSINLHRMLAVPLKSGSEVTGVLSVSDPKQIGAFDQDEIHLLQLFADQAAIVLDNARLYASINREKNFRKTIEDSIPSGISVIDPQGVKTYVNPGFCKMIGYKKEELVGQKMPYTYWPKEKQQGYTEVFQSALNGEFLPNGQEVQLFRKTGEIFDALLLLTPIKDSQGEVNGYLTSITDISALKAAEARVRKSEELYRTLADNFPNGLVAMFNRDLRCTLVAGEAAKTLQEHNITVEGKSIYSINPGVHFDLSFWEKQFAETFEGDRKTFEFSLNGKVFIVNMIPIQPGVDGFENLLLITQEITDRVKNEARVAESEARYRAVVEDQVDMICRLLPDGSLTFVNEAFCHAFDKTRDSLIGHVLIPFLPPEEQDLTRFVEENISYLKPVKSLEHSLPQPDGKTHWQQWTIRGLYDEDANLKELQAVGLDITERKQLEEDLRTMVTHDQLTGLYNRFFFQAEMDRLGSSRKYPVSIILGDVDGLKYINDSYGHSAGDELLRVAGVILKKAFRPEDIVARIGGDEFAILLPETSEERTEEIIDRIDDLLGSFNTANKEINEPWHQAGISLSLGAATAYEGQSLFVTFKKADKAMYMEKSKRPARGTGPLPGK